MIKKLMFGFAAAALTTVPAHAVTIYGVDEINNLITFDSNNPGVTLSSVAISGLADDSSLLAIDFRVRDGKLYGLGGDKNIYVINKNTGVSTLFATTGNLLTGSNFGFDFNPTNGNLRIISNDGSNYAYNFGTNMLGNSPFVRYSPMGSPATNVAGAAYINNENNPATGTTLYVLDTTNPDMLNTLNIASGLMTPVGPSGVNLGLRTSFDIFTTAGGTNVAFAQNTNKLYSVNLATGGFTNLGTIDRSIFAMAVAVPEPATWAMMLFGFGGVGVAVRTRRRGPRSVTA